MGLRFVTSAWKWIVRWLRGTEAAPAQPPAPRRFCETLETRSMLTAVTFTIDPSLSSIVVSGSIGTSSLIEQGAGSLSAHYAGTLNADVTTGSIQFLSANVTPQTTGPWQPGDAVANYAGTIDVFGTTAQVAVRNLVLDVSSSEADLGAGGSFHATIQSIKAKAGELDYATGLGNGSAPLTT